MNFTIDINTMENKIEAPTKSNAQASKISNKGWDFKDHIGLVDKINW